MKKIYLKPTADIEAFSVENLVSVSVAAVKRPTQVIKYTKGTLHY